ncbi:MAG: ribbon-helix-helix protein, CopG family [Acidimicrobiia bacterium]
MIQVAFQLAEAELEAIDALVPGEFPSRAEALRQAVKMWLKQIDDQRIDAALAAAYQLVPPGDEEEEWSRISEESAAAADLDW